MAASTGSLLSCASCGGGGGGGSGGGGSGGGGGAKGGGGSCGSDGGSGVQGDGAGGGGVARLEGPSAYFGTTATERGLASDLAWQVGGAAPPVRHDPPYTCTPLANHRTSPAVSF